MTNYNRNYTNKNKNLNLTDLNTKLDSVTTFVNAQASPDKDAVAATIANVKAAINGTQSNDVNAQLDSIATFITSKNTGDNAAVLASIENVRDAFHC